ncbi:unnamed protein product [Thelazia callipaeda]|uniref:MFS domain-containing protein n=1 Tax=Thelazia callipaeda TaxID=103827 RepID=A0A0N5D271_THECL|nr:unnamed protein product [Thelazia callipaeda]
MEITAIETPHTKPELSLYVYYLAFMAVISGFLFGYDTGIVSCAMLFIPRNPGMVPMNNFWQELIVSLTPGAAVIGPLFAAPISDKFGRRTVIIFSSLIFTAGAIVCAVATTKIILLIGRILLGTAIGFSSMIVPIYVSEASPYHLRGSLTTAFQLMITFGLFAADVLAGVFSYWEPENIGWRLMVGCAMIPSIMQFVGFIFLPESPRYLYFSGKYDKTEKILNKIYRNNQEWVKSVLSNLNIANEREKKIKDEIKNQSVLLRIFTTPHVLKALFIGCTIQAFQQLSGVNSIMYYTATIVKNAGIKDLHQSIWIASAIAAVNFLVTFIPMATVEKYGRRRLMLISIFCVIMSLTMLGISFLLIHQESLQSTPYTLSEMYSGAKTDVILSGYNRCHHLHWCLPLTLENPDVSIFGYCSVNHNETYFFNNSYCKTRFYLLPIIFMFTFMISFAIGYAPLCWVLNSEFYPAWARSTACALSTSINWTFNLIVSLTFLTLNETATRFGAFFVYDGFSVLALCFVFFFVPETKGITMEEVEKLFIPKKERKQYIANKD